MKLLIVGGVAGGASAAARARRLSEEAEIVLFERGPDVSFANCGLPVLRRRRDRRARQASRRHTGAAARRASSLDVRMRTTRSRPSTGPRRPSGSATSLRAGSTTEGYDKLILAPGAAPLRPAIPGIDLPGVFTLRNLQDTDRIKAAVDRGRQAVLLGAGFIGLELAENLVRRGIATTVVERDEQVLPPFDKEMTHAIAETWRAKGVDLLLAADPPRRSNPDPPA